MRRIRTTATALGRRRAGDVRNGVLSAAVATLVAAALLAAPASAQVVTAPTETPFYARDVEGPRWTPVIFYRPPACVPESFNLVQFFDVPRAFECGPMTMHQVAVWTSGPGIDPAPLRADGWGWGAVPIWFVLTRDFREATADGVITMAELRSLEPLMGTAHWYREILQPRETAEIGLLKVTARGTLEDKRSFRLRVHVNWTTGFRIVRVRFERQPPIEASDVSLPG
jgi:hypothetical protein